MRAVRQQKQSSGFTLVETLVAVSIFGLVLTLIGLEFVGVVDNTLHTRANTDAESQARIIMAKVTTHMRAAFWDITDAPPGSPLPIVSPVSTTAPYVTFYRVSQGGLQGTIPTCGSAPCPPFDIITIQLSTTTPGELDEIVTPMKTGKPDPTIVLGRNVSNFAVTQQSNTQYNVAITISIPSSHCGGAAQSCTFTLDNVVYVGGQGSN